ncbi:hypothetical protein TNCV_1602861 [Trichonephila clavipes]|nr:hypothetical protein TNCV_1602861 [Trichonephila clavipes]
MSTTHSGQFSRSGTRKPRKAIKQQPTIYGFQRHHSQVVISLRQYSNGNLQQLMDYVGFVCWGYEEHLRASEVQSFSLNKISLLSALDIKKWIIRKADRPTVNAHKKEVQEKFRRQMGLLVDAPKSGFSTTNNGNTNKAFFWNPVIASSITGIDEILIRKLHVVLATIA